MEEKVSTSAAPAAATAAKSASSDQRSYLAMTGLAFFVGQTGLARVYRGEQIGWVRFWLWIGASVTMIIPFVNFLSALVLMVLGVWGIVDFFLVYKLRDDGAAKPLHTTAYDQKWANVMRILYIIGLALTALSVILGIIFAIVGLRFWENAASNIQLNSNNSIYEQSTGGSTATSSAQKEKALGAYDSLTEGMSKAEVEQKISVTNPDCSEYTSGDTTVATCTYGSYTDGYMIMISYDNGAVSYKSKYSY